jgi:hypothetical protein
LSPSADLPRCQLFAATPSTYYLRKTLRREK